MQLYDYEILRIQCTLITMNTAFKLSSHETTNDWQHHTLFYENEFTSVLHVLVKCGILMLKTMEWLATIAGNEEWFSIRRWSSGLPLIISALPQTVDLSNPKLWMGCLEIACNICSIPHPNLLLFQSYLLFIKFFKFTRLRIQWSKRTHLLFPPFPITIFINRILFIHLFTITNVNLCT